MNPRTLPAVTGFGSSTAEGREFWRLANLEHWSVSPNRKYVCGFKMQSHFHSSANHSSANHPSGAGRFKRVAFQAPPRHDERREEAWRTDPGTPLFSTNGIKGRPSRNVWQRNVWQRNGKLGLPGTLGTATGDKRIWVGASGDAPYWYRTSRIGKITIGTLHASDHLCSGFAICAKSI